jgi:hypothetical protein
LLIVADNKQRPTSENGCGAIIDVVPVASAATAAFAVAFVLLVAVLIFVVAFVVAIVDDEDVVLGGTVEGVFVFITILVSYNNIIY